MPAADDLRRLKAEWDQRIRAALPETDGAAQWRRRLHATETGAQDEPGEDMPGGIPAPPGELQPAVRPDTGMAEYARARESLGIADRGLDSGQIQGLGHRGVELPATMPGADHVRAASAIGHPMGPDARAEYAQRQQAAAAAIYGFRSQGR
jgi:hypothetical protein